MQLPFFFLSELPAGDEVTLDETASKHIVQVLRMREEEGILLTDGRGHLLKGKIIEAGKKHCVVRVMENTFKERQGRNVTIAVSLLKNTSRFEWFLEKASELGVVRIIPLLCQRTEKHQFRMDRAQAVCTSAMLQSRQCWLPTLDAPLSFEHALVKANVDELSYIAHCMEGVKNEIQPAGHSRILIGPEGDFTPGEISMALSAGFQPVSLGNTRLRTETAAIVSATLLRLKK